jgi:hypothetical protein
MIAAVDRFTQPLHGEFDIFRLQMSAALDLGLVSGFWKSFEILFGQPAGGRSFTGELLADEGSCGIGDPSSPRGSPTRR